MIRTLLLITIFLIGLIFCIGLFYYSKQRKKIIDQLKKQLEESNNFNRTLERSNLLNQRIISTLSHDIKGPLLSLEFLLGALETNHSTTQVTHQIRRFNEVLDNLLLWSKHEITGRPNLAIVTPIVPHINDTIQMLNPSLQEKNLRLVTFQFKYSRRSL